MNTFQLLAQPWWANALILVPFVGWYVWHRKGGLFFSWRVLLITFIFAVAFGFVEASVVIYFRAAAGLLPGFGGTLADIRTFASPVYNQAQAISQFPASLFAIELMREAATMVILVCVALLAAKTPKERWAIYFWTFAAWDIFYYVGLWATVKWPSSLLSPDVLFLIPVPWISQVWFPLLVSALVMIAVAVAKRKSS